MKLISLLLPSLQLEGLDDLVRLKIYSNRSEAIRCAIHDLLIKEEVWKLARLKKLEEENK